MLPSNTSRALAALRVPLALLVILLLPATRAYAANVGLAWDPVVNPTLSGYMIHHGPSAGNYTTTIDVGNTTSYTVTNLAEGATYHFAVTAYDAARTQTGYSNNVSTTIAYVSPVADFGASTTSGAAPLAMNFIDSSAGTITTYAWTFGDGGNSSARNPAHTYSTAGVFTVTLKTTGPGGSSTKTRTNYITVTGPADTSPPTVPATLTAAAGGTGTINLSWPVSTDNVGVTGYRIERCQGSTCTSFAQIGTTAGTAFASTGLLAGTSYRYRVRANDAAGNLSGYSIIAAATTATTIDTSAPTAPASLTATASGTGTINLAWPASTDNVGVTGYRIERCQGSTCTSFAQIGTAAGTAFASTGLLAGTSYRYRVRANDAAGNLSGYSSIAAATTATTIDTSAPTAPASLTATASGTGTINLAWPASTDNVGVTGYRIERCQGSTCTSFAQIGTAAGTAFASTGLLAATSYRYRVRANDAAGNLSGYSIIAAATTATTIDTSAPTAPASLAATASGTGTINLSWPVSTDNVGVTGYLIERCQGSSCTNFVQIATPTGTTFSNTGLSAGTAYRYRVRARDAVGNVGLYSGVVAAAACPCSLWNATATPQVVADADANPVELGVKFKSDRNGMVTGIRFYKSSTNTGVHVGSLWTIGGVLLGRATFTNETASGWQKMAFATPVAITANTTYVVSYHTKVGHYSSDDWFFAAAGVDNAPLHALKDGVTGGNNGVYAYSNNPAFPASSYRATNYWVDVEFVP